MAKKKSTKRAKSPKRTAKRACDISGCKGWKCESNCKKMSCDSGGCIYFLGLIGALVYYISTATGFWNGVLGVLKALVWPAMLVFKLLGL